MVGFCGDLPVCIGLNHGEDFVETLAFGGDLLLVFRRLGFAFLVFFFADFKDACREIGDLLFELVVFVFLVPVGRCGGVGGRGVGGRKRNRFTDMFERFCIDEAT